MCTFAIVCVYFPGCIVALHVSIHGLTTEGVVTATRRTNHPPGSDDVFLTMSEHVGRMCSHMGRSVTSTK